MGKVHEVTNALVDLQSRIDHRIQFRILRRCDWYAHLSVPDWAWPDDEDSPRKILSQFDIDTFDGRMSIAIEEIAVDGDERLSSGDVQLFFSLMDWLGRYKEEPLGVLYAEPPGMWRWIAGFTLIEKHDRITWASPPSERHLLSDKYHFGEKTGLDLATLPFSQIVRCPVWATLERLQEYMTPYHSEFTEGEPWTHAASAFQTVCDLVENNPDDRLLMGCVPLLLQTTEILTSLGYTPAFSDGRLRGPFSPTRLDDIAPSRGREKAPKMTKEVCLNLVRQWISCCKACGVTLSKSLDYYPGLRSDQSLFSSESIACAYRLASVMHKKAEAASSVDDIELEERHVSFVIDRLTDLGLEVPIRYAVHDADDPDVSSVGPFEVLPYGICGEFYREVSRDNPPIERVRFTSILWLSELLYLHQMSWHQLKSIPLLLKKPDTAVPRLAKHPSSPLAASIVVLPPIATADSESAFSLASEPESLTLSSPMIVAEIDRVDQVLTGIYGPTFRYLCQFPFGRRIAWNTLNEGIEKPTRTDGGTEASLNRLRKYLNDCNSMFDLHLDTKNKKVELEVLRERRHAEQ